MMMGVGCPVLKFVRSLLLFRVLEELPGAEEDCAEHRISEFAGGGVLLAGMEGADEHRLAGGGAMFGVVGEDEVGAAGNFALVAQDGQINIKSQAAERDDDFEIAE